MTSLHTKNTQTKSLSYQRDDKGFLEPQATGNGEDRTEAREHGSKEDDLPDTRIDRQIGKVVPKRGEILLSIQSILLRPNV